MMKVHLYFFFRITPLYISAKKHRNYSLAGPSQTVQYMASYKKHFYTYKITHSLMQPVRQSISHRDALNPVEEDVKKKA